MEHLVNLTLIAMKNNYNNHTEYFIDEMKVTDVISIHITDQH